MAAGYSESHKLDLAEAGESSGVGSDGPAAWIGLGVLSLETRQWLRVNDRLCQFLKCDPRQLWQLSWPDLVHPEDREREGEELQRILDGLSDCYQLPVRLMSPSGSTIPICAQVECVRGPDGEAHCLVVLVRPADELEAAPDGTAHGDRMKPSSREVESTGSLAAAVGHHFNNLLLPILGHAELLAQEVPATSHARDHIQAIMDSVRSASELCGELLLYSGAGSYTPRRVYLNEIVGSVMKSIRTFATRRSQIQLDFVSNLPCIEGDPDQIQQLVTNTISNAAESMEGRKGAITVRTGTCHCSRARLNSALLGGGLPEGTFAVLEVTDTGIGMDKEARLRLFEPFFSTKFGHSGLGMATVKGIMGRHRGAMEIHSQPGQGTVIRYLFPLPHDAEDVLPAGKEKSMEDELLPGGTILLVDDEEHVLRVGTAMLSKLGFSVVPAMGGAEALDLYRKRREDIACIILDLTMPDLGGEAVLEAIRREDSSIPIVISSGFSEKGVARRVGGKTISGFLAKPYGMAELREALRKALK